MSRVIGRADQQALLEGALASNRAEFIAVYGRRRVGKTYLVRETFRCRKNVVFFNVTGAKSAPLKEQAAHFCQSVGDAFLGGVVPQVGRNWDGNFKILNAAIDAVPSQKKIVLFFDELPWMVTKNSRLLEILEYYWNHYWSNRSRLTLIVCGSSASWIIDKIINNKGGLHNRITQKIWLKPYTLSDAKKLLRSQGVKLNHQQIVKLYMTTGGVPYYLSHVPAGLSAAQNYRKTCFSFRWIII